MRALGLACAAQRGGKARPSVNCAGTARKETDQLPLGRLVGWGNMYGRVSAWASLMSKIPKRAHEALGQALRRSSTKPSGTVAAVEAT